MNKMKNNKKLDIEAYLFLMLCHLKEDKNKEYSIDLCPRNIAYIFDNYDGFRNYFYQNGISIVDDEIFDLSIIKITKKGTVIALKGLCDHIIRKYNSLNEPENKSNIIFDKSNGILDNLGHNGVNAIINDESPIEDVVYRPSYPTYRVSINNNKNNVEQGKTYLLKK